MNELLVGIYVLGLIFVAVLKGLAAFFTVVAALMVSVWEDIQDYRATR